MKALLYIGVVLAYLVFVVAGTVIGYNKGYDKGHSEGVLDGQIIAYSNILQAMKGKGGYRLNEKGLYIFDPFYKPIDSTTAKDSTI